MGTLYASPEWKINVLFSGITYTCGRCGAKNKRQSEQLIRNWNNIVTVFCDCSAVNVCKDKNGQFLAMNYLQYQMTNVDELS